MLRVTDAAQAHVRCGSIGLSRRRGRASRRPDGANAELAARRSAPTAGRLSSSSASTGGRPRGGAPSAIDSSARSALPAGRGADQRRVRSTTRSSQINQLLCLIYALLALAVDRRRCSASSTRSCCRSPSARASSACCARSAPRASQVRRMIRYEAVITALIGGVLGVAARAPVLAVLVSQRDRRGLHADDPASSSIAGAARAVGRRRRRRRDAARAAGGAAGRAARRWPTSSQRCAR